MNNPTHKYIQIIQKSLNIRQAIMFSRRLACFCFGFFISFFHSSPPFSITDNRYAFGDFQVWGAA